MLYKIKKDGPGRFNIRRVRLFYCRKWKIILNRMNKLPSCKGILWFRKEVFGYALVMRRVRVNGLYAFSESQSPDGHFY